MSNHEELDDVMRRQKILDAIELAEEDIKNGNVLDWETVKKNLSKWRLPDSDESNNVGAQESE